MQPIDLAEVADDFDREVARTEAIDRFCSSTASPYFACNNDSGFLVDSSTRSLMPSSETKCGRPRRVDDNIGSAARVRSVSAEENLLNSTGPSTDYVRLRYATFDPTVGVPAVPAKLRATAGNELFLVQFRGTPLDSMRAQITAMGGTVERFLTDDTHAAHDEHGHECEADCGHGLSAHTG